MRFFYNLGIYLMTAGIRLASLFMPKADKWVAGRRNWRNFYPPSSGKTLWMHVSSLGEFEQGRPILEQFRSEFPDWRVVLTFFSPSGYELRKNYPFAHVVGYLPADTPSNARDFLALVKPDAAIFVKYDFWANYLSALKKRGTPTLLVSALFRPSQPFFKWYGRLWRDMLGCFSHIFVQNQASEDLLHQIGFQEVTVAGDTRVDRVLRIASDAPANPTVESFAGDDLVFVAGSSWEADERCFIPVLQMPAFRHYKVIIAPHEPSEQNADRICRQFDSAIRYSQYSAERASGCRVLVIDNIGLLNTLYRYGHVAYIGGGFGKGIHNTLEPAAFGLPVVFGPKYGKFEEARQFVSLGGAFPVRNSTDLQKVLQNLEDQDCYAAASKAVRSYLNSSNGASEKAMAWMRRQFQVN